ncbi:Csmd3 [Symbiodinium natans]|uniref:Csmd3 protein n=1 Tax=Symbiodinium natans TaxID=878477 RepID=A0A812T8G5_9DINO|nr:Csmd3 [Symbiodinium natans]
MRSRILSSTVQRIDFNLPLGRLVVRLCWQRCHDKYPQPCKENRARLAIPSVIDFSTQYDSNTYAAANLGLRSGGRWRSSFKALRDQWLILDLGVALRLRRFFLPLWGTAENPQEALLQSGDSNQGPWEEVLKFGIPSLDSTLVTVEIPGGPVARFLRLSLAGNFGAPWGLALRGPLRLAVEEADVNETSNSTGDEEDNEVDELCTRSHCYAGCGLLARRTTAEQGMALEELPPATGDAALLNFEWLKHWWKSTLLGARPGLQAALPTAIFNPLAWTAVSSGGDPPPEGSLVTSTKGFFCNMGVDLTGASVGVDGSSRVTMQNSSNATTSKWYLDDSLAGRSGEMQYPQQNATAQANPGTSFLQPRGAAVSVAADGNWATFDLGYPTASGPFQICYCLSADDCSQDLAFSKWVGTVAVIGKVRRLDPSGWDLAGQVSILVEITDLGAPIINVTFISQGLEQACLSASPVAGQETTAVQCLLPAAFTPGLETVTAFAANGLWATSVDIFNRFVRGSFINISDTFGPTLGGEIVTIYVTDLGAPITHITFGFVGSPYVLADGRAPSTRAICEVPATAISGAVSVTVMAANGNVATGSNVYSYYRAGDISNLNPSQGEMGGNTRVTIETTDLDATIVSVFFGGNEGLIVGGSATSNFVVALTPESEIRGAVDVVVIAENQNEAIRIGGFTYLAVCPDPGVPLNGARSGEELSEGAILIFSCQFGYELVGSSQSVCQMDYDSFGNVISESSAFSPPAPTCQIVSCPDPGIPDFGFRTGGDSGTFVFGDVVTFSCSPGYLRVGPTELICRGDGRFSGSAPSCESNLGSLNLVRYRALFLASFQEEVGVSQVAYQQADANGDGLVSEEEFLLQAAAIGVTRSADAEVLYQQIQHRPGVTLSQQYITLEQYRVLEPEVSITELRTLMASVFLTPAQMLSGASLDGNPSVWKEEFVGQVVSVAELTTVNAEAIWDSVARLGQSQLDSNHYLLLMGQDDLQTLRALMQVRFLLVDDAWNASNPNGDDRVTEEEFVNFLLQDYGLDAVMGELSWRHIDVFFQGYVLLERYVALGFGSVEGVSLVGFRGFLQSLFATKEAVVSNMDSDGSGIVTNDEFKRFVTRTLGLTSQNADDVLASLCQDPNLLRLTDRQLDAISYDLTLPSLRILLRADHPTLEDVLAFLDTSQDSQVSQEEWVAGLLRKRVTSENALELFTALDPGQLGYLTADSLRMIRGHLALCDYRELVKSDLGDLNQTLLAADTDGNQLVTPEEFVQQAVPFCLTQEEALALHAEMDFLSQGFVDLFAMSLARTGSSFNT